jgi:predicted DsbA family dithiol-disulfide isomerase
VELIVLAGAGCPNVGLMCERVAAVIAGRRGVRVRRVVVEDERRAVEVGMTGSPTLLVDGADPFAVAGSRPSLSCRLYPQADGSLAGAPPVEVLRRALESRGLGGADDGSLRRPSQ